jgi:hypothetical protein
MTDQELIRWKRHKQNCIYIPEMMKGKKSFENTEL